MLRKLFNPGSTAQNQAHAQKQAYNNLIRKEAIIGGQLFGIVPKGHRREFFCLDEHTWIWHEEWADRLGQKQIRTTRYDMRPSGVVKTYDGRGYHALSPTESQNLKTAIGLYYKRVMSSLYGQAA